MVIDALALTHERVDNREQICVLTGVNDAGDMFFEIAGRGNIDPGRAAEFLEGKVASGAIVSTDGSKATRRCSRPSTCGSTT